MSIRENIQCYPRIDVGQYLNIIESEFCADVHPTQRDALLVDGLPFYRPQQTNDHTFILGFNYIPLSDTLLQPLIRHPEFFSDTCVIRWTQEQELLLEVTLSDLRVQFDESESNHQMNV